MNKKFKKIIALFVGSLLVISVILILMIQLQTPIDTYGLLEPILGVKNFSISAEHRKDLGIENASLSNDEKNKLDGMIEETIKAQDEYYLTKKDEKLEKIKDLYLPDAFENYKKETKNPKAPYLDNSTRTIKLSSPRAYKDLPDRVGIISLAEFGFDRDGDVWPRSILQVFIFKKINGEWKIEKQQRSEAMAEEIKKGLEKTESGLVKEVRDQLKKE